MAKFNQLTFLPFKGLTDFLALLIQSFSRSSFYTREIYTNDRPRQCIVELQIAPTSLWNMQTVSSSSSPLGHWMTSSHRACSSMQTTTSASRDVTHGNSCRPSLDRGQSAYRQATSYATVARSRYSDIIAVDYTPRTSTDYLTLVFIFTFSSNILVLYHYACLSPSFH